MIVRALLAVLLLAAAADAQAPPATGEVRPPAGQATPAQSQAQELIDEIPVRAAFVVRDGEPRPLDAELPHPGEVAGLILEWPDDVRVPVDVVAPGAQVGDIIPLKMVSGDPRAGGGDVLEILLVGLGEIEVPSILLRSLEDGKTFMTGTVKLEVASTLAEDDTEPAPTRGQAAIGLDRLGIALWVLVAVLILAAALFWWWRRRTRPQERPQIVVPEIPADVWARKALDRLLSSGILEDGQIKMFHVELAAISKEYLSRRYGIHLMERTTAECPDDLRASGVDATTCLEVGEWLAQIDLVKFAGEHPGQQEIDTSVKALRMMIENTRPRTSAVEPQATATAAAAGVAG